MTKLHPTVFATYSQEINPEGKKWKSLRFRISDRSVVRGLGKRAINVIFQVPSRIHFNESVLAIEAAKVAVKRGWKTIVVREHSFYEDYPEFFNLSQLMRHQDVPGINYSLSFEDTNDYLINDGVLELRVRDHFENYGYDSRFDDFCFGD